MPISSKVRRCNFAIIESFGELCRGRLGLKPCLDNDCLGANCLCGNYLCSHAEWCLDDKPEGIVSEWNNNCVEECKCKRCNVLSNFAMRNGKTIAIRRIDVGGKIKAEKMSVCFRKGKLKGQGPYLYLRRRWRIWILGGMWKQRDKQSDLPGLIPSLTKGEYNNELPSDY